MKQHERILDIQLHACSLLLRTLGQGGFRATPVSDVDSGTPSQSQRSLGNQPWLHSATHCPAAGTWGDLLRARRARLSPCEVGALPPTPTPAREGAHLPATCPVNPGSGGNPGRLPSAQAALARDPAAEVPSESSVVSVLLSCLRIHPESEQLLAMVYSVLTIISSQGGCAWPSLSRAEAGALPGHGGVPAPDAARPALPSAGVAHAVVLFYLPTRSFHLTVTCSLHKRARHRPGARCHHGLHGSGFCLVHLPRAPGLLEPPGRQAVGGQMGNATGRIATRALAPDLFPPSSPGQQPSLQREAGPVSPGTLT